MKTRSIFISMLFLTTTTIAQVKHLGVNGGISTDFVGWDNTVTYDLKVSHDGAYDIDFFTNGSQKMVLESGGNLGIGTTTPGYLLDVNGGDINLGDDSDFYRINGDEALFMDDVFNLMVGTRHNAGNFTTGRRNIMIGHDCGPDLTDGEENILVGNAAGQQLTTGDKNTFFGECSGRKTTSGNGNSFLGSYSGLNNTTGYDNTFIGYNCGWTQTRGNNNLFAGKNTGMGFTTAIGIYNNVVLGSQAAYGSSLTTGNSLTLVGYNTEAANNLSNAGAIGANAIVEASNSIVIGGITGENGGTNSNVGIGTTVPAERFHVVNNAEDITGLFVSENAGMTDILKAEYDELSTGSVDGIDVSVVTSATSGSYTNTGVRIAVDSDADNHLNFGIHSTSSGTTDYSNSIYGLAKEAGVENIGVQGVAESNSTSRDIGVKGIVTSGSTSGQARGVEGRASTSTGQNNGGYFTADGSTGTNYGVFAAASGGSINYSGYFSGAMYCTSTLTQNSDLKLKEDIRPLVSPLAIVKQLKPVSYRFKQDEFPTVNLPDGERYGLIAQDLELVLPSLVSASVQPAKIDAKGIVEHEAVNLKGVNYIELIPFSIAAIQEQQEMIEEKEDRIVILEKEVERLAVVEAEMAEIKEQLALLIEHGQAGVKTDVTVGFADNSRASHRTELHQNRPNPFRQATTFSYTLGTSGKVELSIHSMEGVFIETVVNNYQEKGDHKVEWDSKDLPNGVYFYILTVDGVEWVKKAIRLQ